MERTCFAFEEERHNHCKCKILTKMNCTNCKFYKHKNTINFERIEEEIKVYAKEREKAHGMGVR